MAYDGKVYTARDVMTPQVLRDAAAAQREAAEVFYERLGRVVEIHEPDLPDGIYTPAYPSLINVIEGNLARLCDGGYYDGRIGRIITWRGELEDVPRFSCLDVNRWFGACEVLKGVAVGVACRSVVTGRAAAGYGRDAQQFYVAGGV